MSDEPDRVARTYEGYAASPRKQRKWNRRNAGNAKIRSELFALLRQEIADRLEAGSLLDVGCGTGWLLTELAGVGVDPSRLNGLDLLEARVSAVRRALPQSRINLSDAVDLPYEDESFDVVTMICLLSSLGGVESMTEAIQEARRVLRPGGLLTCYEPRLPNPFNRNTVFVSNRVLNKALGHGWRSTRLTVLPPLARALEPAITDSYDRLAQFKPVLTHKLVTWSPPR